jgi:hypothetical protein
MLVDLAVNEVDDDAGDMAVVVMSSRNVVAIGGKSRARQPGAGATARPVVVSRVALDVL